MKKCRHEYRGSCDFLSISSNREGRKGEMKWKGAGGGGSRKGVKEAQN